MNCLVFYGLGLCVLILLNAASSANDYNFGLVLIISTIIYVLIIVSYFFLKSPFHFPYFTYSFDVSGKRKPSIENCLDEFLNSGGFAIIESHQDVIERWKIASKQYIERSLLKQYRRNQFERACDFGSAFRFNMFRYKTRYKQVNYVKYPYKVKVLEATYSYGYLSLKNRYNRLADIDFACTLQQYHSKNQRSLCTRAVREKIMKRDHYTCQICGKYMPDEVGLQVDHIVPISRGGKTISSNLRVLCSKCNGSKSDKL